MNKTYSGIPCDIKCPKCGNMAEETDKSVSDRLYIYQDYKCTKCGTVTTKRFRKIG
ncbi:MULTISPECIES: hypothetical protein [Methanobacterium]|uniref:Uncharacterized protein n=1 Tax=Methanobacterium veterum TaxID=408577 RepID=A0A9E5A266_9EURY|nr:MULTISPECIES: hypothetical protein [Methanobacterium]MCZ3366540.1 hypothetical protein [Methanobacterium veterum]MCZ3371751.1 hypothetical protein [Methanobacterium veterum]